LALADFRKFFDINIMQLFLLRNADLTGTVVRLVIFGFAGVLGLELFSSSDIVQCAGRDTWAEDSDEDLPNNPINQPRLADAIARYALGGALVIGGIAIIFAAGYYGPKAVKAGVEMIHQANQNMSMVLRPD
jgi:hypothetical protein